MITSQSLLDPTMRCDCGRLRVSPYYVPSLGKTVCRACARHEGGGRFAADARAQLERDAEVALEEVVAVWLREKEEAEVVKQTRLFELGDALLQSACVLMYKPLREVERGGDDESGERGFFAVQGIRAVRKVVRPLEIAFVLLQRASGDLHARAVQQARAHLAINYAYQLLADDVSPRERGNLKLRVPPLVEALEHASDDKFCKGALEALKSAAEGRRPRQPPPVATVRAESTEPGVLTVDAEPGAEEEPGPELHIVVPPLVHPAPRPVVRNPCKRCGERERFGRHEFCGRTCAREFAAEQARALTRPLNSSRPGGAGLPNAELCKRCGMRERFGRHDFCGRTCAREYAAEQASASGKPESELCKQCGKRERFGRHEFCGRTCAKQFEATQKAPVMCKNCGNNPVFVEEHRVHEFCGRTCASLFAAAGGKPDAPLPGDLCRFCGMFPVFARGTKVSPYCSRYCARQATSSAEPGLPTCAGCGKRPVFVDSKTGKASRYCSRSCLKRHS